MAPDAEVFPGPHKVGKPLVAGLAGQHHRDREGLVQGSGLVLRARPVFDLENKFSPLGVHAHHPPADAFLGPRFKGKKKKKKKKNKGRRKADQ